MNPIAPTGNTPLPDGTLQNLFYPPLKGAYTYFARAAERPFAGGSEIVKAAWAADAAMLSYARYGADRMPDADFTGHLARGGLASVQKIGDWQANGTQGFFASNDRFAILAFRGTEADDPVDIADDLALAPLPERDYRLAPQGSQPFQLSAIEHLFADHVLVHQGFQRALDRVWDQVLACVNGYRQNHAQAEICFAGHSLGGALAELAFSRFADSNLSLFTIGCPRVGNEAFCDRVSDPQRVIFRCVNFNDAVTHIPTESMLYRHGPQECHRFDQNGNLAIEDGDDNVNVDIAALEAIFRGLPPDLRTGLDQIAAPPSVVDHSPARYCIRLWNCV
jgi:hypothetical protein